MICNPMSHSIAIVDVQWSRVTENCWRHSDNGTNVDNGNEGHCRHWHIIALKKILILLSMTKIAPLLKITNGANTMTITNEAPLALIWILNDAIASAI